jgi:hypothetical protein
MRFARVPLIAFALLVAQAVPVAVLQAKPNPTVYITRTGHKYHSFGCRYLRQSCIAVKLSDAKAQGETPCSVCLPPR